MRLHPKAQQIVDESAASGRPNAHFLPVDEARANFESDYAALGKGEPVTKVEDLSIPGPGGDIPVRFYLPATKGTAPLVVYFHGGGWLLGSIDSHDYTCRRLAKATGAGVASVDYRRAPEHRFPAAVDDALVATDWVYEHAGDLSGNPDRLAVAGDSAGGNLAIAVALRARDQGRPPLRLMILAYPVTTTTLSAATFDTRYDRIMLWEDELRWHQSNYLASEMDFSHPLVSPLDHADLAGLPPTALILAECDPIRPQGEAFARELMAAGVEVDQRTYEGMIHGFFGLSEAFDGAPDGMDAAAEAVARMMRQADAS